MTDAQHGSDEFRHVDRYEPRFDEDGLVERSDVAALLNSCVTQIEAMKAQWRRVLDVNVHERMAMAQLWESGSMSMSDLGDRINLSRAALTSLVDRLEAGGYVTRESDASDRRRTIVTMTHVPTRKLIPTAHVHSRRLTEWVAGMPDDEWDVIRRFLHNVGEACREEATRLRTFTDSEIQAGLAATQTVGSLAHRTESGASQPS